MDKKIKQKPKSSNAGLREQLAAKTFQLKIEASLERVRKVAMTMKKPEHLSAIGKTFFLQLKSLGFTSIRNTEIVINNDNKETVKSYHYSDYGKEEVIEIGYKKNPILKKWARDLRKTENAFVPVSNPQKQITAWKKYRKELGYKNDPKMARAKAVHYYSYAMGPGAICISCWQKLTDEQIKILEGFRNVFRLSNQRYLDLTKAEAQAREAQIEAALERVRSKTMTIQRSEELDAVIKTVYSELKRLDVSFIRCFIMIFDEQKGATWWMGGPDDDLFHDGFYVQYHTHPPHLAYLKGWEERQQKWEYLLAGQIKKDWDEFIFDKTELSKLPPVVIQYMKSFDFAYLAATFENFGCMTIGGAERLSEESFEILRRFAKVFDQTYTRFNDLKNAEAQAREAQIEVALERIRARSMAMHNSDELWDVINVVFTEFGKLAIQIDACLINIYKKGDDGLNEYVAAGGQTYPGLVYQPYINHPIFNIIRDGKKNPGGVVSEILQRNVANRYWRHLFAKGVNIQVSKKRQKYLLSTEGIASVYSFGKYSSMAVHRYSKSQFSEEDKNVVKRFCLTFDQIYTRFLDLQKAEAQAREAQIEVALERVRAKAMAMHTSNDLKGVALELRRQMGSLGLKELETCAIHLYEGSDEYFTSWAALQSPNSESDIILTEAHLPRKGVRNLEQIIDNYNKRKKDYLIANDWKNFQEFSQALKVRAPEAFRIVQKTIRNKQKSEIQSYWSVSDFKGGSLLMSTITMPEQDSRNLLRRFTNVFDLAYQRFTDLKKAEERAREAQIEVALERIRARSMAMYKSDELSDTASIMFNELKKLGVDSLRTGVCIFDYDKDTAEIWLAAEAAGKTETKVLGTVAGYMHPMYRQWIDAAFQKKKLFRYEMSGKEVPGYYKIASAYLSIPKQTVYNKSEIYHGFIFPGGSINIISLEPLTDQECDIGYRFANVFGLLYRRFLDLKKAEAQAREAEIQLALERVRARTMAMHKSEELAEVTAILFQQFQSLGSVPERMNISIIREDAGLLETWPTEQGGHQVNHSFIASLDEPTSVAKIYSAWKKGKSSLVIDLSGEDAKKWFSYMQGEMKMPVKKELISERRVHTMAFFSQGALIMSTPKPVIPETINLLERFAAVFNLTYRRFLDLQKAEGQAREAEIQLALERIRARTMAMQRSEELREVISVVFEKLQELGLAMEYRSAIIAVTEPGYRNATQWVASELQPLATAIKTPYYDNPIIVDFWEAKEMGIKFYEKFYSKEEKNSLFNYFFNDLGFEMPKESRDLIFQIPYYSLASAIETNSSISLATHSEKKLTPHEADLLKRFAAVFEQTYTRFLDLQKAEAQARESQVQLALERVRARTMAMQKSGELPQAAKELFQQVQSLGIPSWAAGYCIWEDNKRAITAWMHTEGVMQPPIKYPTTEEELFIQMRTGCESGKTFHVVEMGGQELVAHYRYMYTVGGVAEMFDSINKAGHQLPKFQVMHYAYFSKGFLLFITYERVPEAHDIFKRFSNVFDQTYTRFLDLQTAEAQAREAQIEASLERVRARTMAMQKSDELAETASLLFKQIGDLGLDVWSSGFQIWNADDISTTAWMSTEGGTITAGLRLPYTEDPFFQNIYNARHNTDGFFVMESKGKELEETYRYMFNLPEWKKFFGDVETSGLPIPKYQITHCVFFAQGYLMLITHKSYPEYWDIFKRFGRVFEQTYTRFLDLQKAEAQAREAQVEASLERVRAKAMGMHNSEDLSGTASMVFTELRKLGITPLRCGVGLLNKESRRGQIYYAASTGNLDRLSLIGYVQTENHPVLDKIYDSWLRQTEYFPVLHGKELISYYESLLEGLPVPLPEYKEDDKHFGHFIPCSVGFLYAWSDVQYTEDQVKILKRFASIIDLTFRRYLELQKAEANAKEAIKQAALDRIRADIASMRTVGDLDRITPLIWNELTILGIPFIRCGVFIMDEMQKLIHTFLSTPDGKAIAAFHIPYDAPGKTRLIVENWRNKRTYIDHWNDSDFLDFAHTLVELKIIISSDQYLSTIPHGGFYLHCFPFLQGMLYVGNTTQLKDEDIDLIQSVAEAFSTAYARYEDFNKLEAAKQQVDKTLTDLKQTQQQLVQSEKMASLGELTAGIAHEIQNPLNFVNNFSDVSNELLQEMKDELAKGNLQQAIEIADQVRQNLEKILNHGKRADGIVKGMLQHSRTSSGQKELTDINALADEYLRLAFHGFRAKDKSFAAKFETHFDPSVGKIKIISQEIGRVVLNLINNAFYAVNEKAKAPRPPEGGANYEPMVSVGTIRLNGNIQISVKDNGNGIPGNIKEKIFQPFFTTKPAGQGTGLGLSLSYDIVKAHSGEMKVESKEGQGSEFIIMLPTDS